MPVEHIGNGRQGKKQWNKNGRHSKKQGKKQQNKGYVGQNEAEYHGREEMMSFGWSDLV